MLQCSVCMLKGLTAMAGTIMDGQALCGRHGFKWMDYMNSTSHAANPSSMRITDFFNWLAYNGG